MKNFYLLFFLFFLNKFYFLAQPVNHRSFENDIKLWQSKTSEVISQRDTAAFKKILQPLKTSKFMKDQVLYHALMGKADTELFDGLTPTAEKHFESSIKKANKLKDPALLIWTQLCYAECLYNYREMTKALPVYLNAIRHIENISPGEMIFPASSFKRIGYYMGTIGDNAEAIIYLRRALQHTIVNTSEFAEILDNIGQYYFASNDYKNAEKYFVQASVTAKIIKDDIRYAKTLGNIGRIRETQGNFKEAVQLLEKDIAISEKLGTDQNTMFAYTVLAKVFLKDQQWKKAESAADKAEAIAQTKPYYQNNELEIIKLKLDIYSKQNRTGEELTARRKMKVLEDSLKFTDGALPLIHANLMAQKAKYQLQMQKVDEDLQKESLIAKTAVVIAVLVAFLLTFNFFHSKRKERKRQQIYDAKIKEHELEKNRYEEKLLQAQKTLHAQIEYLKTKNYHIKQLTAEIEEIKNSASSHIEEESGRLHEILDSHLMTEENWQMFRREFQKEYPDFYQTLKTEFPEITNANLRIILLQKMGFSSSEISALLGITQDAVKKSRQRLKRKLGDKYDQLFSIVFSES